ncbi:MAG: VOC family protein [Planctomycetes bacterium]|nr:VOC family protein [Planctomycetota bacterium]MCB9918190.1 VOC family protein [Planctomycetota bacterium]
METTEHRSTDPQRDRELLDVLHHVAIPVKDLDATVDWYLEQFSCSVAYRDSTWALLRFRNCDLAFVMPGQHPPHHAIIREDADSFGELVTHRDGSRSCYLTDPSNNRVEVCAPDHLEMPC